MLKSVLFINNERPLELIKSKSFNLMKVFQ